MTEMDSWIGKAAIKPKNLANDSCAEPGIRFKRVVLERVLDLGCYTRGV